MSNISVKDATKSGAWLECHINAFRYDVERDCRLRVVAFERKSVEEIVETPLDREFRVEGVLCVLGIEVVNLSKTPMRASRIKRSIRLVDKDGFEFEPFKTHLECYSKCAGLERFTDGSPALSPKVKASGAILFVLPDEENNYHLAIKDGHIREV
jgi:hypothetical protein